LVAEAALPATSDNDSPSSRSFSLDSTTPLPACDGRRAKNNPPTGRTLAPPPCVTPCVMLARRISPARRSCHGASPPRAAATLAACLHRSERHAPRDRQQDVVDKQRVSLVGMAEGGQQQVPQAGNREVVDARAGLIAQIANSRRVGVVRDRVQRRTRQIKNQRVKGLVGESGGRHIIPARAKRRRRSPSTAEVPRSQRSGPLTYPCESSRGCIPPRVPLRFSDDKYGRWRNHRARGGSCCAASNTYLSSANSCLALLNNNRNV
jgi:hypothetical protein